MNDPNRATEYIRAVKDYIERYRYEKGMPKSMKPKKIEIYLHNPDMPLFRLGEASIVNNRNPRVSLVEKIKYRYENFDGDEVATSLGDLLTLRIDYEEPKDNADSEQPEESDKADG